MTPRQLESLPAEFWTRLHGLSAIDRAVYVLYRWFDYPHVAIAEALGMREHEALQACRRVLAQLARAPAHPSDL